jgi:hypothetical protein
MLLRLRPLDLGKFLSQQKVLERCCKQGMSVRGTAHGDRKAISAVINIVREDVILNAGVAQRSWAGEPANSRV